MQNYHTVVVVFFFVARQVVPRSLKKILVRLLHEAFEFWKEESEHSLSLVHKVKPVSFWLEHSLTGNHFLPCEKQ